MSITLTDMIYRLQDLSTQHPGSMDRVRITVPSSEQFEIGAIHHDGAAVVLACQPSQGDSPPSQDETPRHQTQPTRAYLRNDYCEDLV